MIFDHIDRLKRYAVPRADTILNFLGTHDCAQLTDGEQEIEGRDLFVRIMSYVPKPAQENKFEVHRQYADLQYVAHGAELMQTARRPDLTELGEYDAKKDFHFFKTSGPIEHDLIVKAREFTVFYPGEAHRTASLYEGHKAQVKKLVFKVKIS